jgi:hypothetical protein
VFCILIPISASTPFILGKSRMRKRTRTDLCGGTSDRRPYRDSVHVGVCHRSAFWLAWRSSADGLIRSVLFHRW